MRALKVSTIVFVIVAIIGIAVIMGRFVFKLGPAKIGDEPKMASIAVSYTHLDVYKRQVLKLVLKLFQLWLFAALVKNIIIITIKA